MSKPSFVRLLGEKPQPKLSGPQHVEKRVGNYTLHGYKDVKCLGCGDNIPFFTGNIDRPYCRDCSSSPISKAGNTNPSVPREIRRYSG